MIMEYNLETIQSNLKIKYINNLINGCNKSNIDTTELSTYLDKLTVQQTDAYTVTEKNVETEKETEKSSIEYLYLKPWTKLTIIHKIIKIKEFVNNLDINNDTEKEELKDNLIELIKNKKTKNKINYDATKGQVLSISELSFENGKYVIKTD